MRVIKILMLLYFVCQIILMAAVVTALLILVINPGILDR